MRLKLFLGLLSVFACALVLTNGATYAVSGSCYFTSTSGPVGGTGTCSEPGLGDFGANDVLTGRSSDGTGSAIPSSVNSKKEFINFILDRFGGGTHDKIGAAFIMQDMRGSNAWPSSADVDDWVARMNNPDVSVSREWDPTVGKTSWYDNDKKNTFYASHPTVGRWVVKITYKGGLRAEIEYRCGNMVAGTIALPKAPNWKTTSSSTVAPASTILVGGTITWTHTIKNTGPDTTNMGIGWTVEVNDGGLGGNKTGTWGSGKANGSVLTRTYTHTTVASDIGKSLCQRIIVDPWRSAGGSSTSAWACTTVIAVFNLTPSVAVNPSGIVDPGTPVTINATVTKAGTITPLIYWQLSKIVVAPGGSIPGGAPTNPSTPEAYFGSSRTTSVASGTQSFSGASTLVKTLPVDADDLPAGTRICWALSVKPPSNTYGGWRHSEPICIKIGKSPKIQVLGGDIRVRGAIDTSTTNIRRSGVPTVFGSWVEYGAFSVGINKGFASGAGTRNGTPNTAQVKWSNLTFANVDPTGGAVFGKYVGLPSMSTIAQYFSTRKVDVNAPTMTLDNATPSGLYKITSANLILDTDTVIDNGKSIIIVASGTVTINKNIRYATTEITNLKDIPQLVIIASKIVINANVDHVDAWLVASDWINTCSTVTIPGGAFATDPGASVLTVNACNVPLTVNGPVAASKLYLYRTAGSGPGSDAGNPAETFNFRPDASLWAYNYGLTNLQPSTSSVSGLPPRF